MQNHQHLGVIIGVMFVQSLSRLVTQTWYPPPPYTPPQHLWLIIVYNLARMNGGPPHTHTHTHTTTLHPTLTSRKPGISLVFYWYYTSLYLITALVQLAISNYVGANSTPPPRHCHRISRPVCSYLTRSIQCGITRRNINIKNIYPLSVAI